MDWISGIYKAEEAAKNYISQRYGVPMSDLSSSGKLGAVTFEVKVYSPECQWSCDVNEAMNVCVSGFCERSN